MKIVLIGPAYPIRGGNALFVAHLYEALSQANDVQVISYSRLYPGFLFPGVRQTDISGVAMKKHPATQIIDCMNPLTWFRAARIAASMNPDMLVFTWWNPFFGPIVKTIAAKFKKISGKPVVIIAENVISHEGRSVDIFLTKMALETADRFLVLSAVVEENIGRLFPEKKVYRSTLPVYDCYDTDEKLTAEQAQKQLGLDGKKVILFFGYIRKYKGLANIIEALPSIREKIKEAHLLVVGEFYDDPETYYEQIAKFGLENDVTIINKYVANEKVHVYFSAANVVVLPYIEATQSGILSIAYGFAKPVIVTDAGGLSELVDDGKTGFIVPACDNVKLADAVVRYFENSCEREFASNIAIKRRDNSFGAIRSVFDKIYISLQSTNNNGISE